MLGLPLPVVNKASHDILKYAPLDKMQSYVLQKRI